MMIENNDNLDMILYSNIVFECETCLFFYQNTNRRRKFMRKNKTVFMRLIGESQRVPFVRKKKKKKNNPSLGSATSKRARFDI